ncbi:glycoside hydrolase family 3 N-terminal domain-containing protein [Bifidobacterium subtile]|jgi:beta-glucosidase|uniref:beta-glucosidase n=1 Tax=Bifidobacterium subtile TaxID=77635 RepID=A0A087EBD2_9BIFI|nr:glycoside hydrolase family 3 N-terminal domain-containing protein [Bifidobacterium subtile]KFJ05083.1 glycoside hydrolase 3 domain protein [Bifidobacterium subtile]MCI1220254.1 glycoside hydrolase family 3 C-terminal domain-containing protein [Bifidobacterium sp.]QOL37192.1 glycoside hydrolase family 3 C-terminal domain-containing protein [Bifidobacterium subtile]
MSMEQLPYMNNSLPVSGRVDDLLSRMTLEEKVGQMMQTDAREDLEGDILRVGVGSILHVSPENIVRAHELTRQTRLHIPVLIGEDCIHGYSFWKGATIYPTQLGMAASWDPSLLERVARATAQEVSPTGVHWTFSPVLCIARDLRWGRVGETFGEDPFLIGELASAMVRGYQDDGPQDKTGIMATAKHFAAYSETQGGRDASEADVSPRKLRSWYLPPFERVAKEGCRAFMLGYQSIDGIPITLNKWLIKDVLKKEWGYEGILVTDWANVGRLVWEQKVQPDHAHAAAAAVKAGVDLSMTTPEFFDGALQAVGDGLLSETDLDAAVRRILAIKFELGLFEDPRLPQPEVMASQIGSPEHAALNLEAARRSLVLLHNDGTLPLASDAPKRVAVVGQLADDAQQQLGDWAGGSGQASGFIDEQPRTMITTVLDGLRQQAPSDWTIAYAQGAGIVEPVPYPALDVTACEPDDGMIAEAVAAAKDADHVIAVVGDRLELVGEGHSTATLELIGGQKALLEALAATGTPMTVVLMASKPLVLPDCVLNASSLIWAANPGMRGGQAIAELILGQIEPSGRLPISFARHAGQLPIYYNQIRGQHGAKYADLTQDPQFAFGEGLSYTTVEYSNLHILEPELGIGDTIVAEVTLRNTGTRPALEIVQAYVSDLVTSVTWADKELKGYRQAALEPGEETTVRIEIPASACSIVNADAERVVEPGQFELRVGPNSREENLLRARFAIGEPLETSAAAESTLSLF